MNDLQTVTTETHPIRVEAPWPETSSRLLAACGILFFFPKTLLLIPHLIVLWFLSIASLLVAWVGQWIVLVTGSLPKPIFQFVLGTTRWQTRMNAWYFGLTDRYPPFSLE